MTLIAITADTDQAVVLTDTAAYTPNLRRMFRTTKYAHLQHLDAMLLTGGIPLRGAWARFALETDERTAFADFDTVLDALPQMLPELWAGFEASYPSDHPGPGVLLAVGYSQAEGRFVAAEYGSDAGFVREPIEGTYLHPTPWRLRPSQREYRLLLQAYEELGAHPDVIRDIREGWLAQPAPPADLDTDALLDLARETREDRSMGGGIPIAGELVRTTLRRGRLISRTVWTFPTSGPEFERFVDGTDHPAAQAATCTCGSGLNVLSCCRAADLAKPCRCGSGDLFRDCCMVAQPSTTTTEGITR